jgi:hypothetical protein
MHVRFKRTCVGSNGILECKFLSENAHRTNSNAHRFTHALVIQQEEAVLALLTRAFLFRVAMVRACVASTAAPTRIRSKCAANHYLAYAQTIINRRHHASFSNAVSITTAVFHFDLLIHLLYRFSSGDLGLVQLHLFVPVPQPQRVVYYSLNLRNKRFVPIKAGSTFRVVWQDLGLGGRGYG